MWGCVDAKNWRTKSGYVHLQINDSILEQCLNISSNVQCFHRDKTTELSNQNHDILHVGDIVCIIFTPFLCLRSMQRTFSLVLFTNITCFSPYHYLQNMSSQTNEKLMSDVKRVVQVQMFSVRNLFELLDPLQVKIKFSSKNLVW